MRHVIAAYYQGRLEYCRALETPTQQDPGEIRRIVKRRVLSAFGCAPEDPDYEQVAKYVLVMIDPSELTDVPTIVAHSLEEL